MKGYSGSETLPLFIARLYGCVISAALHQAFGLKQHSCSGFYTVCIVTILEFLAVLNMQFKTLGIAFLLISLCSVAPTLAQFGRDRPDFFEQGQDQLDREIQRLQTGRPGDGLLTIQGEQVRWQQLILKQGGFTVWMPAEAIVEATETLIATGGTIEFKVFSTHPQSARFLVAYAPRPDFTATVESEQLLDQMRDGIVKKTNFTLERDRTIALWGYPGRELSLTGKDEAIAIRLYVTDQRLYVLGVGQTDPEKLQDAAIAFFNSFRLLRQ